MRNVLFSSLVVLVLPACGMSHGAGPDAHVESDGGSGGACTVEGAIECVGLGRGRECHGGAWTDFWDGPCAPPPPDAGHDAGTCFDDAAAATLDPLALVHFRITGSGWVVQRGMGCSPYAILREGGSAVPLGLPFQCVCECPAPPPPTPESLLATSSEPVELTWDGRQLTTWSRCADCGTMGWPGAGWQRFTDGALQPTLPGHYTLVLPVLDELPENCTDLGDGTASCAPVWGGGPGWPPPGFDACPGTRTVEVEFDLPESGEVLVAVDTTP